MKCRKELSGKVSTITEALWDIVELARHQHNVGLATEASGMLSRLRELPYYDRADIKDCDCKACMRKRSADVPVI